jgi:hypothetical protein
MAHKDHGQRSTPAPNVIHSNDGLSSQLLQKGLPSANLQTALRTNTTSNTPAPVAQPQNTQTPSKSSK